jgi:DNA-binding SARP family transcriptional activator/streptogramin lyase
MEFRILGPLEVLDGSRPVPLDAPKQRALLGLLLLHPNEVVSSERVIDELWGERPPATAGKVVQTYVSQLRRTLGADLITTRAPGYALEIGEEALDAERFRRLTAAAREAAANGDVEQADTLFCEGLALWRGPPLADVAFESFARNEVERLAEERLDALSARIDCELALGHHEQLVTELETLVGAYPLRERLRAQLMLALYRSGRQADALEAYQNGRRLLVGELGLEPGRELQDLEKAILTHDPALDPLPIEHPASQPLRHRLWRKPVLAIATLLMVFLGVGLAFAFARSSPPSLHLASNSVGFIDAKSGRVTRKFSVGRAPSALAVAHNSVWVANYQDQTVTRIDPKSGKAVFIPVSGHPTGIAATEDAVWVWTLEGSLVPIDPRFDSSRQPIPLAAEIVGARGVGGHVAAGAGFLWIAAPLTTVIRVNVTSRRGVPIMPDDGVEGAITYHDGEVWVAGEDQVFPIEADTRIPGSGASVGVVHDLAFGAGSLWAVSGGVAHRGGIVQALRRIDPHTRFVLATIPVGSDPVSVASAGGSIWVASLTDGVLERVSPEQNRVVDTIALHAKPVALASDPEGDGVWVAVH